MRMSEKSNRLQQKSASNLIDVMQYVLSKAKTQGATDAVVTVNHDTGFAVDVRLGEVETVTFNEDKSMSVTLYIGKRKGTATSTDLLPASLEETIAAAYEIAKVSAEDPCFGLADKELMTKEYPDLDLYHPWSITPQEAIELALVCEAKALSMDKRIKNSDGVSLSTYNYCQAFANTNGGQGIVDGTIHSLSCSLIAQKGKAMQQDYDFTTSRLASELVSTDKLAKNAVEHAVSRLGAKPVKTQKVPVIFSPRVSGSLIGSFTEAINGINLYRKNSFLLDSIGKQVFPAGFKIYEQPYLLQALGSSAFDSEGVPTRNNVFVEDGRIQQYILNSYCARRLKLQTTANAGGVHNLTIEPNAGGLEDLVRAMGKGLLVTDLMGKVLNLATGDYSRGAKGFWIEYGEIQFPVEEVTIAGNLNTIFQSIQAVGNDWNPNYATRCGSILIGEMMVAGR